MLRCLNFLLIPALLFATTTLCAAEIDFNRDIRPILSENCFFCHGPDAKNREADLRLDEHAGALAAIVPRKSAESELFARISSTDEFEQMPPPDSNRKLTKRQIELLKQWINEGAEWGEHWSWTPIAAPNVPKKKQFENIPVRNPIDAFIQQELVEKKLAPAVEAEKHRLLRRVTFDLTGLPPTSEEYTAFAADHSPDAYEKVVDRLLASPNYGERMAWDWLDASRYADTNGYQGDRERTMWPWRDWVVKAFNENMPYDQFTVWQLAGDLLPDATLEQKLATGFCRNHPINGEGGRIAEENRVDYVFDMAETTGTVWLGLTFNCCRCHDHKYDALLNKDYYSFTAFFNQTPVNGGGGDPQTKPVVAVPTNEQQQLIDQRREEIAKVDRQLKVKQQALAKAQLQWEAEQLKTLSQKAMWSPLQVVSLNAEQQSLKEFNDGSIFASGENPNNDTYTVTLASDKKTITGIRLDALRHDSHFKGRLARSNSGNFVLTEFEVAVQSSNTDELRSVKIKTAEATYEQNSLKVTNTFDGNPKSGWAVLGPNGIDRDHAAIYRFAEPLTLEEGEQLVVTLRHNSQHVHHNIGRFRLTVTDVAEPKLTEDDQTLLIALQTLVNKRDKAQKELLATTFRNENPEYKKLIAAKKKAGDRLAQANKAVAKVMVMENMPKPRQTFILDRGLYTEQREEVVAAVPESLPALQEPQDANRLDLAEWLVSKENPLTARVTVNRLWQQLFGIGLVKTTEDFGVQAEIPIHLDLLNWLAADFRNSGWDVRRLMKQVVMSHTYRQSSKVTKELIEQDPENRLLARGPRYRMPSWMLRDQALAVSGLLVNKRGGPSVNVYQPAGVWEEATFGKKTYKQDHGDALYRRSLYIFWRRIAGPTVFFDNASRLTCEVKPYLTNTPLHALQTLNDTTFVEAARALAQLTLLSAETDGQRLNFVFSRVLGRDIKPAERTIFLKALQRTKNHFERNGKAVDELLSTGESPRDESLNKLEHAGWTALCLGVLNLDETLTKE